MTAAKVNRRIDADGRVLCSHCRAWLPAEQFQRKADGYTYDCRSCIAQMDREARERRNPGRVIEKRTPRLRDDGTYRCTSCSAYLPVEHFRSHQRRGKIEPHAWCRTCEDAKRSARRVADGRRLPAVTNETRKPARVVSVPVTLAPERPVAIEPSPRPSRLVQPLAADESRKRAIQTRTCAQCEQRQPITNYPMFGVGRRRLTCSRCLEQSAPPPVVETPKPAPVVLAPRPAKPIVYPKARVEDCVYWAHICWADDARALAALIHQQGIAPGIVRGFFTTVGDDEHEYCRPMFERQGLAALFDELMKAKYGIRDQREAA